GAFTASHEHMALLKDNPIQGHITTFGGNPVIAAAALATLEELVETNLIPQTIEKEKLFRSLLVHPLINEVRGKRLMLAPIMKSKELAKEALLKCKDRGFIILCLLFKKHVL